MLAARMQACRMRAWGIAEGRDYTESGGCGKGNPGGFKGLMAQAIRRLRRSWDGHRQCRLNGYWKGFSCDHLSELTL